MKITTSHLRNLPGATWYSILLMGVFTCLATTALAATHTDTETWAASIPDDFGGHITLRGTLSHPAENTWQEGGDDEGLLDGAAELRLKYETVLPQGLALTVHYENMLTGGDSRRQRSVLLDRFPTLGETSFVTGSVPEDDRRLLDLTSALDEDDGHIWYHRLDRLYVAWHPGPVDIRLGRQAVTWGNGMIFNPMDLFNPFPPTDVERDYKIGDDMLSVEGTGYFGQLHLLVVPRRDPADHHVSSDHSSAAVKYHVVTGGLEWDAMAGLHCRDFVAGGGVVGYLGRAAWRLDAVLTVPDDAGSLWTSRKEKENYLSVVANADLSWVWFDKNWYGLLEWYYNGLMSDEYARDTAVPYIAERLARGDLHTLGRWYAAGTLQFEAHPLLNLYLTAITNLEDPSGVILPRLICDLTASTRITLGGSLYWGGTGAEYGDWSFPAPAPAAPGTTLLIAPADTAYTWLTWYF